MLNWHFHRNVTLLQPNISLLLEIWHRGEVPSTVTCNRGGDTDRQVLFGETRVSKSCWFLSSPHRRALCSFHARWGGESLLGPFPRALQLLTPARDALGKTPLGRDQPWARYVLRTCYGSWQIFRVLVGTSEM